MQSHIRKVHACLAVTCHLHSPAVATNPETEHSGMGECSVEMSHTAVKTIEPESVKQLSTAQLSTAPLNST